MPAEGNIASHGRQLAKKLGAWVIAFCLLVSIARGADTPLEYDVKAAFLLNFTKFIDWPESAFSAPDAPFAICILGPDAFKNALDKMVEGETVNARKLVVRRVQRQQTGGCQILFVSKSEKNFSTALAGEGMGVLTVGESDSFFRDGGVINFVIENKRVRFDVNQTAAKRVGLDLSSKLLQVARKVD